MRSDHCIVIPVFPRRLVLIFRDFAGKIPTHWDLLELTGDHQTSIL